MIKKAFSLSALFLYVVTFSFGQNDSSETPTPNFKHAVGAGAGFTTGHGLAYRFWPKRIGAQVTFAPRKQDNLTEIHAGLTFFLKLVHTKHVNLFVYQGNQYVNKEIYVYNNSNSYYYEPPTSSINHQEKFNNGLGLGMEFLFLKRVSLNIMGGYAAYNNFEYIAMTGEAALLFRF